MGSRWTKRGDNRHRIRGGIVGSVGDRTIGGSPDRIAVTFKGGANDAHVRKPWYRIQGGGDHARDRFLYKIFFFFLFTRALSFLLSAPWFASAFRSRLGRSGSGFLSRRRARVASVSSPPCRAYNVRPDRTWIRRHAGSFLTDIFGYPRRLESDLWSTSVTGSGGFLARSPREIRTCMRASISHAWVYNFRY